LFDVLKTIRKKTYRFWTKRHRQFL